jgi:hypothetical protein
MNEFEHSVLTLLAQNDRGLGGYQARNILDYLGENHFIDPVFPSSENEMEILLAGIDIDTIYSEVCKINAYPNPASSIVNFVYEMKEFIPKGTILNVMDFSGKSIYRLPINEMSGVVIWDGSFLPSGLYFYHLIADSKIITKTKPLILMK